MAANILLVVLFIAAIVISILVLLQNKSGDMGSAFGGGSNTLFGARGSADFLTRATSITATVFFLSALALAYIYANQGKQASDSVIQSVVEPVAPESDSEIPDASDIGETQTPPATTEAATEEAAQTDTSTTSEDAATVDTEAQDAISDPAMPAEETENEVPAVPE